MNMIRVGLAPFLLSIPFWLGCNGGSGSLKAGTALRNYSSSLKINDDTMRAVNDEEVQRRCDVYLVMDPVEQTHLRLLAKVFAGKTPVHCTLIWVVTDPLTKDRTAWQTSLEKYVRDSGDQLVGGGDGYIILKSSIGLEEVRGRWLGTCNSNDLEFWMSQYASRRKGDLTGPHWSMQRDWYTEPQGYGGPMYDRATSNTYISWLLKQVGLEAQKPEGALGWDCKPTFPGPNRE